MWLAAETTDNEEFKAREEAVEQEGEAERELVEERGRMTEQEGEAGSNTATGREGATGRAAAEEGAQAAERKGATGREGATERGALDLLRHVYLESLLQHALRCLLLPLSRACARARSLSLDISAAHIRTGVLLRSWAYRSSRACARARARSLTLTCTHTRIYSHDKGSRRAWRSRRSRTGQDKSTVKGCTAQT
jgi:hypothetical protein